MREVRTPMDATESGENTGDVCKPEVQKPLLEPTPQEEWRTYPKFPNYEISNLGNVRQARPQTPMYPKVSQILGNMIVAVLLGKSQPQAALSSAAQQVNQALANPNG